MRCRLCAAQCNNNPTPLFRNGYNTELNKLLAKYLCIEVKHNDPFSTRICLDCVQHLKNFDNYFHLIEEKQNLIQNEILTMVTIKNEPPDDPHQIMDGFPFESPPIDEPSQTCPLGSVTANLSLKEMLPVGFQLRNDISENEIFVKEEMLSGEDEIDSTDNSNFVVANEADVKTDDQLYQEHSNNSLNCRICGHVSMNFEDAKTHYNAQHNVAFKDVYIICCGLRFYTQKPYDDHRNSPPCTFRCDICNKKLLSAKTLHFHKMAVHTDRQEYKYACDICGERFMFLSGLKEHIPTHTNKKPFKCDICGSSYARLSYLRVHKYRHSTKQFKTKKVFDCELCQKEFSCEENFQAHLAISTNNNCLKNNARSIEREVRFWYKVENKCCICDKVFKKKNILQRHLEVHIRKNKLTQFSMLGLAAEKNVLDTNNDVL